MPALQRLSRAYASRNLVVVGIDQGEEERVVARYIRSIGTTYPILLDEDQRYGAAFAAVGLPTSVFIAADGTVMMQIDGEMSYQRMVTLTDRLLRASPSPGAQGRAR
jgi:cytochrome c biogenesis protein CcmG, thiol:disulfide interchange protein DsbE